MLFSTEPWGPEQFLWKYVIGKISGDCYWPKSSANAKLRSSIFNDLNGKPASLRYCLLSEHCLIYVPELCISQSTFCRHKWAPSETVLVSVSGHSRLNVTWCSWSTSCGIHLPHLCRTTAIFVGSMINAKVNSRGTPFTCSCRNRAKKTATQRHHDYNMLGLFFGLSFAGSVLNL